MRAALDAEGAPDRQFSSVLIAGTNGKGSVASLMHAGLLGAGYRVGLFTSPHLVDVRERIRVDGEPIGVGDFVELGERVLSAWAEGADESARLTYFELITLIAMLHFAETGVHIAVVEVGLGGRLDATNTLDPCVSIVTPVALDHTRWLGDDLATIFSEKLAVLRRARPAVVCRPSGWDVERTLAAASQLEASPLMVEGRDFEALDEHPGWLHFAGQHQRQNAAVALAGLSSLGLRPQPGDLGRARWPGRWTEVDVGGPVWVDCAHNPESAAVSATLIRELAPEGATLVVGASADKDIAGIAAALATTAPRLVATAVDSARAMEAAPVAAAFEASGVPTRVVDGVESALAAARTHADPVVALGSIYLVGKLLELARLSAEELPVLA